MPVATVSIAGARNAGILAARILALADEALDDRVEKFVADLTLQARTKDRTLQERLKGA